VKIYLTIKNYRCFVSPATVEVARGFTAFVGLNNAGKSTFMRFLLEFRPWFGSILELPRFFNALNQPQNTNGPLHVMDPHEVFSNLNEEPIEFSLSCIPEDNESRFGTLKVRFVLWKGMQWRSDIEINGAAIRNHPPCGISADKLLVQDNKEIADLKPVLDTLGVFARSLYIGPFRNTINVGTKSDYLDIQIGEAFIKQFHELKTGPNKRSNEGISKLTEEIRNIFKFSSLDIAPSADQTSIHLTVNSRPYKQHEVGSGLLQFIIVLANAAIKTPQIILIDEPELNLHPALQLNFLTALGKYAEYGVWYSTHSLGLARSSAERVYSVSKDSDGDSKIRPLAGTPRLSEFLGEMSFSSYKELGFEKLLLVEGPTEVKAIQHFLRLLTKDRKILPLPLHGHMPKPDELEEILRITANVVAIIDSERLSENSPLAKDRRDFLDLCVAKQIMASVLDRRAFENYLSDNAIKSVFGGSYRALNHFEKLADANPHWSKSLNWKVAEKMTFSEIRDTDLGRFLMAI
jgi:ABC-type Mn2+/Zn2+ transport system ATPase subunit